MNDITLIGLFIFFGAVVVSRILLARANKKLTPEKLAEMVSLFRQDNIVTGVAMLVLIGLFFLNIKFGVVNPNASFFIYIAAILVFYGISVWRSYRKLIVHDFPTGYIQLYILSNAARVMGLFVMIGVIGYSQGI